MLPEKPLETRDAAHSHRFKGGRCVTCNVHIGSLKCPEQVRGWWSR